MTSLWRLQMFPLVRRRDLFVGTVLNVGDSWALIESALSRNQREVDRFARPPYWMFGQFAGAGASIRRFALFGSKGTSWTAMVEAGTEPSFRMMCT